MKSIVLGPVMTWASGAAKEACASRPFVSKSIYQEVSAAGAKSSAFINPMILSKGSFNDPCVGSASKIVERDSRSNKICKTIAPMSPYFPDP